MRLSSIKHQPKTPISNSSAHSSSFEVHNVIFASIFISSALLFSGLFVSAGSTSVHAEETDIQVNVPDSIALSASPTLVNIGTLAPESFGSAYTDLTVSTNSAGGYSLKIASATNTTSLVHTNGSATGHLDSITSPVTINTTGSNFPGDKWGYSVGLSSSSTSKDYKVVPASTAATEIAHKEAPVMDDVTRVNFGTRPTSSSAAGTYTGTVTFTATAKEIVKDITLLTSMQDLANHPEYCANTAEHVSTTIKDERDNQQYTIFKAKDGNCWMGENLRYGVNPDGTGHPFVAADAALSNSGLNATKMLDLTYDATNPNTAGRIKNGESGMKTADGSANAFAYNTESFTEPYINIYQANDVADYDGQTKYGVLYNYCAVTGGTACTASSTDYNPTGSICPKGWKLPGMTDYPTGTSAVTDGSIKSYNNLANSYGYGHTEAGMNGMFSTPINLLRAGYAYSGSLSSRSATGYGYYLSSTKYNTIAAYRLTLHGSPGYVEQSNQPRYWGGSARCVSE